MHARQFSYILHKNSVYVILMQYYSQSAQNLMLVISMTLLDFVDPKVLNTPTSHEKKTGVKQ